MSTKTQNHHIDDDKLPKKRSKKKVLKKIAEDLREFDFGSFDPRKDKQILMTHLQSVNSKLGKLIRDLTEEEGRKR